jgi:hypothetical protein
MSTSSKQKSASKDSRPKYSKHITKMLKYFPELKDKDEYITEFTVDQNRSKINKHTLNPDKIPFRHPDFGFNDYMTFKEEDNEPNDKGWKRFMDSVSMFPQFERVKNYIDFIHTKKMEELDQHMDKLKKSLYVNE